MKNLLKKVVIVAQIFTYILSVIVLIQMLRIIFSGSWRTEDVILAVVVLNLTMTLILTGYLFYSHTSLYSKIAKVENKLDSHLAWHRGRAEKLTMAKA